MNKRAIWGVVVLLIIIVVIWGFSGSEEKGPTSSDSIKIGASLPLTGIAAIYGEHQKNAISLAVEEINASGGILGKQVEVLYEDDATDPKRAVSAVQKLITTDGAQVIVGGVWDFLASAIMPIIDSNKRVLITTSVSQDMLEGTSPYHFSTYMPISDTGVVVDKFLTQYPNAKIAIVAANNLWGKSHAEMFKNSVQKSGATIVKEIILPKFEANDVQRELTLIKASGANLILVAANYNDSVSFAKKRVELNIMTPILSHANFANAYADGQIDAGSLKDVSVFRPAPPKQEFVAAYTRKFGKAPLAEADSAYDAIYAIKHAMEKAGDASADAVLKGLRQVDFSGASGRIDYSEKNYPENKTPILQKFDGQNFVEVK